MPEGFVMRSGTFFVVADEPELGLPVRTFEGLKVLFEDSLIGL